MAEQCDNCKFSLETAKDNYNCRRNPPVPVYFVNDYGVDVETGARTVLSHGAFPGVNHNWWCGEWKPKTIS
jgi:hypothetical protein